MMSIFLEEGFSSFGIPMARVGARSVHLERAMAQFRMATSSRRIFRLLSSGCSTGLIFAGDAAFRVELVKHGPDWGDAAPWLVALGALAFSIYQFFTTTRVKRLEYLDGLAKTVRDEPLLQVATQMLDWEVRTIEFRAKRYVYSVTMLEPALGVHTAQASSPSAAAAWLRGFNEIETLIRDAFDALFGFLENIQYAVDLNVITQDDVYAAPLSYYLGKLCEKDEWTHCAICRYLAGYGFPKTERLLRYYRARFSPKIEPLTEDQIQICNKDLESELRAEEVRKAAEIKGR